MKRALKMALVAIGSLGVILAGAAVATKLYWSVTERSEFTRWEFENLTQVEHKVGLSRNLSTSVTDKRGPRLRRSLQEKKPG